MLNKKNIQIDEDFTEELTILNEYLAKNSYKRTKQRENILQTFLTTEKHLSVEELLEVVREKHGGNIGLSTIYRTMKLLCDCGLAEERTFGDGQSRFEHHFKHSHHDHMVCLSCGEITEFKNDQIEKLQEEVAKEFNFNVTQHKLELFGHCSKCVK